MTTFLDLFRQPTTSVNEQFPVDSRHELFPVAVEQSRKLHLWAPGQPTTPYGPRILLGVATWSGYDMHLLDLIEDATHAPIRIDVFDIDQCKSLDDLRRFVPDVESGSNPPLVSFWNDGRLIEYAWGFAGRQLATRVCNLDPGVVERRMQTLYTR